MGLVIKFGGSVLKNNLDIIKAAQFVKQNLNYKDGLVIVVGAMGSMTHNILDESASISGNPSEMVMDFFLATAEQTAVAKLTMALQDEGLDATPLNGYQLGIVTDGNHRNARVKSIDIDRTLEEINKGNIVVATGFQGVSDDGNLTTFDENYGGSDLSAVIIAAALGWDCVLYKDVNGIYTVNPQLYARARKLDIIDYREAIQIASAGNDVIEAYAVELAEKFNIPVYVSAMSENYKNGTKITHRESDHTGEAAFNIAATEEIVIINAMGHGDSGIITELFRRAAEETISVDVVIKEVLSNEDDWAVSFSMSSDDGERFMQTIAKEDKFKGLKFKLKGHLTGISLVGLDMATTPGITSRMINALVRKRIKVYNTSSSEISITVTVDLSERVRAIVELCKEFKL